MSPALLEALLVGAWVALVLLLTGSRLLALVGVERSDDRLGWLGWSLCAGSLAQAMLLMLLQWLLAEHVTPLGLGLAQVFLILSLGLVASLGRRARQGLLGGTSLLVGHVQPAPRRRPAVPRAMGVLFNLALVAAVGFSVLRFLDGNLVPALAGDEAMLWGYRARAIVSEGGLGRAYVEALASPNLRHEDYPLANPLLQAWVLGLAGPDAFVLVRLPAQLLALGLITSLAAALRRHAEAPVAAALLVGFAALPHTRGALASAGAEGGVALGLLLAVDGWLRYRAEGRRAWLGLASLGLALALFCKNDAVLFVLALGTAAGLGHLLERAQRGPIRRQSVAWLVIPAAVLLLQQAYNLWAGFSNDLVTGKGSGSGFAARLFQQAPTNLGTTTSYFGSELLTHPRYDGLVLGALLIATLTLVPRVRRREERALLALVPALATLFSLLGLLLIYVSTPQPLTWHLESSAQRVVWQLLPLACLGLALVLGSEPATEAEVPDP